MRRRKRTASGEGRDLWAQVFAEISETKSTQPLLLPAGQGTPARSVSSEGRTAAQAPLLRPAAPPQPLRGVGGGRVSGDTGTPWPSVSRGTAGVFRGYVRVILQETKCRRRGVTPAVATKPDITWQKCTTPLFSMLCLRKYAIYVGISELLLNVKTPSVL